MKRRLVIITFITLTIVLAFQFINSKQEITDVEFFKNKAIFNSFLNEVYTLDLIYFTEKNKADFIQNDNVTIAFEDNNFISILDYDVVEGEETEDYQLKTLSMKVRFNEIGTLNTSNLKFKYANEEFNYDIGDYEFITHQADQNDFIRVSDGFPIITDGISYRASLENYSNKMVSIDKICFNNVLDKIEWNIHLKPNNEIEGVFELDASLIDSKYDFLIIRPLIEFTADSKSFIFIPYATYYNYLTINDDIIEAQKDK